MSYLQSDYTFRCIFCGFQGDRFGGALDGAAHQFTEAYDSGMIPMEFVNSMRKKGQLIMGIGHRVKSVSKEKLSINLLHSYLYKKNNTFARVPISRGK